MSHQDSSFVDDCVGDTPGVAVAGLTILDTLVLHAIGVLDYPFNSGVRVQPDAFEQVLHEIGGGS